MSRITCTPFIFFITVFILYHTTINCSIFGLQNIAFGSAAKYGASAFPVPVMLRFPRATQFGNNYTIQNIISNSSKLNATSNIVGTTIFLNSNGIPMVLNTTVPDIKKFQSVVLMDRHGMPYIIEMELEFGTSGPVRQVELHGYRHGVESRDRTINVSRDKPLNVSQGVVNSPNVTKAVIVSSTLRPLGSAGLLFEEHRNLLSMAEPKNTKTSKAATTKSKSTPKVTARPKFATPKGNVVTEVIPFQWPSSNCATYYKNNKVVNGYVLIGPKWIPVNEASQKCK